MELLLQDIAVTGIALGAAVLLVRRVYGVVASSRKSRACGTCPACEDKSALSSQART